MDQAINFIMALLQLTFVVIVGFSFVMLTAVIGVILYFDYAFKKKVEQAMKENNNVVMLIRVRSQQGDSPEAGVEKFLRALHRVLPNNTPVSFEMVSKEQFLGFYIVLPKVYRTVIESQLYAQFPDADVEEVDDYLPTYFGESAAIAEVNFKRLSVTSIKTHGEIEENLLKNIASFLAKTDRNEKVFIQLALTRIGTKVHQRGFRVFLLRMLGKKSSHPKLLDDNLYRGRLRIAYLGQDYETAREKLRVLSNFFKSLKAEKNELKIKLKKATEDRYKQFKTRLADDGHLWTVPEVATVYHFPDKSEVGSNIMHTTSKRAPAPDILPRQGLVDPKDVSFIGETNFRNDNVAFGIKRVDRRRHMYVVGKTGSGKSKMLELLLISDIMYNHGLCLVDPHGDLSEQVLKYIPKHRVKDVIYVNPADRDFPIGFNPLEKIDDYEQRLHLSRFFIAIFKKMFADTWNSRMEHLVRYITLALLETEDSSIMGIPRMLSDTAFRLHIVKQIHLPGIEIYHVICCKGRSKFF